jgi:RHS repeat-associated protein
VGNILNLQNQVDIPPASSYGGPTNQTFVYDDLYRLTHAQGTFQYAPGKIHTYGMDMAYDSIHNIVSKHQLHTIVQPSTVAITQKKTSYDFAYAYNPSGLNAIRPHAPTHIGDRTYSYDANGNQTGWTQDTNGTNRTIIWNEENRIESVADQGQTKTYKYDDQGTRVIKRGPQGETVYVNQFYTQRPGATGSKHVYAGTSRIVSKLVKQDTPGANPQGNTPFEKDLFFYHPDHLGTSNYITDTNGKIYEHLEYFPFGETWVEENSNTQRTPYLFTAKELDEETGLYYYGARYYDPRTSVWQSGDPILGKYLPTSGDSKLPGMGGVFNSKNIAMYGYAALNPLAVIDPDGKANIYVGGADDCARAGCTTWFSGPSKVYSFKDRMANAASLAATPHDMFFTWREATQQQTNRGEAVSESMPSAAFSAIQEFHKDNPKEPIDILGHSWGGPAGLELLGELEKAGIAVRSVNTFDPVGTGSTGSRPGKPESSKATWKNFFPGWRNRSETPDKVSKIGGEWNYTPQANENYRVDSSFSGQPSGHLGVLDPKVMTRIRPDE